LFSSHATAAEPAKKEKLPAPRTVTSEKKQILLSEALSEIAKQTGVQVEDRRESNNEDTRLTLPLQKGTIWEVLDAVAREADARISLFQSDGKIAIADGPYVVLPTSYSGIFRTI